MQKISDININAITVNPTGPLRPRRCLKSTMVVNQFKTAEKKYITLPSKKSDTSDSMITAQIEKTLVCYLFSFAVYNQNLTIIIQRLAVCLQQWPLGKPSQSSSRVEVEQIDQQSHWRARSRRFSSSCETID